MSIGRKWYGVVGGFKGFTMGLELQFNFGCVLLNASFLFFALLSVLPFLAVLVSFVLSLYLHLTALHEQSLLHHKHLLFLFRLFVLMDESRISVQVHFPSHGALAISYQRLLMVEAGCGSRPFRLLQVEALGGMTEVKLFIVQIKIEFVVEPMLPLRVVGYRLRCQWSRLVLRGLRQVAF